MTKGYYTDKDIRRDGLLRIAKLRERDLICNANESEALKKEIAGRRFIREHGLAALATARYDIFLHEYININQKETNNA